MPKTILQKVLFKNTRPMVLYELYMDSSMHAAVTGAPALISGRTGGNYSAHGGYMKGRNLQLIRGRLIVQSWHASDWPADAVDSTFILLLEQKGQDTLLHLCHAHVPDGEYEGIKEGWHTYYWKPWKKYLSAAKAAKKKTGSPAG